MRSIKKKEDVFFRLLKEDVALIAEINDMYQELIRNFTEVGMKADMINEKESQCDEKAHHIIEELNKAFITPFDREDIFVMVKTLDDIADTIEVASSSFVLYDTKELREGAVEMAGNLDHAVKKLVDLFDALPNFKKNGPGIKQMCIDVHSIESVNDDLYRKCIYRLFHNEESTLEIIKWNHLYKTMEDTIDVCDHIAQLTEGIVMKHA